LTALPDGYLLATVQTIHACQIFVNTFLQKIYGYHHGMENQPESQAPDEPAIDLTNIIGDPFIASLAATVKPSEMMRIGCDHDETEALIAIANEPLEQIIRELEEGEQGDLQD
jgi:hypothetical protein